MKTIHKYRVTATDNQEIKLPKGAKILTVQVQHNESFMWIEIDPENDTESKYFEVFGTGHSMPEGKRIYIGTFQLHNGALVFHLYERLFQ